MNLAGAFDTSANRQPEKLALFCGEQEFSYSQLQSQTALVSGLLARDFGTRPGERVGIWLKNCPEFISALFGILRLGAVVVPINNFLKPDEVNYILGDAEITTLITDNELGQHRGQLVAANPRLKLLHVEQLGCSRGREEAESVFPKTPSPHVGRDTHPAVIIYTSGTTGRPKGAVLSHSNLLHNVESCRIVLQTVQTDRFVVLLPMFHSYMLTVGLLLPLLVGGSIVLVKSLHPVRSALQEILSRQATILPAIPQFYRSLVHSPITSLQPLRLCISGAAPLPAQILKEFEAKFHLPLIEGYGLSEASPVVTKNPLDGKRKPGSIGLPIPNVEVSIQDDAGRNLPPTEIGEVCVRGGNVMQGYWKRPEETAKVMRGGWLLTGDIGYRDADGYFYITDRKKDMLLVNGLNVYPREIEEVLYQHPGVKEAAVIGKPDARRGEQPVAFVSANEGSVLDEKVLQQFVRTHVADYKVPRKIVFLPALPRNATGKILKTSLRQLSLD
jgi:long-chain acyl-CoA synthetase